MAEPIDPDVKDRALRALPSLTGDEYDRLATSIPAGGPMTTSGCCDCV